MGKMKDLLIELQETPIMTPCPDCWGTGSIEVEFARPHNFNRDVGYLDTRTEVCETCFRGFAQIFFVVTDCSLWNVRKFCGFALG